MITKKLEEMLRRQSTLAAKMLDGSITDSESEELRGLNRAVKAATDPEPAKEGKTTLRTVKLADFQAEAEAAMQGEPTPEQLAVLKRNLSAVKDQGVTDPEGLVAVEVLVEPSPEEKSAALEARIRELESKVAEGFDGRTQTGLASPEESEEGDDDDGDGDGDGDGDAHKAKGADISQQLATEALDSLISRFAELKDKVEDGALKMEDVQEAWHGDWDLRNLIEGAAAVLGKLDEAKGLVEEITPKLEALDKEPSEEDGEGDAPEEPSEKGDGAWPRGDLAGAALSPEDQFRSLRKHRNRLND